MIKLISAAILIALAGPVQCGSVAGPPDPPPTITAPVSAQ